MENVSQVPMVQSAWNLLVALGSCGRMGVRRGSKRSRCFTMDHIPKPRRQVFVHSPHAQQAPVLHRCVCSSSSSLAAGMSTFISSMILCPQLVFNNIHMNTGTF